MQYTLSKVDYREGLELHFEKRYRLVFLAWIGLSLFCAVFRFNQTIVGGSLTYMELAIIIGLCLIGARTLSIWSQLKYYNRYREKFIEIISDNLGATIQLGPTTSRISNDEVCRVRGNFKVTLLYRQDGTYLIIPASALKEFPAIQEWLSNRATS